MIDAVMDVLYGFREYGFKDLLFGLFDEGLDGLELDGPADG